MDQKTLAELQMAAFLINLGLVTVDKIKAYFAGAGHDDETLAAILTEVDARIAARTPASDATGQP
jgi:hypothetical protein